MSKAVVRTPIGEHGPGRRVWGWQCKGGDARLGGCASTIGGTWSQALGGLLLVLAFGAPLARAQDSASHAVRHWTTYEDLQLFSQVLNELRINHADSLDTHVLVMAAIAGMVHAADPHSFVIPVVKLSASKAAAYRAGQLMPVPLSLVQLAGGFVVTGAADGSAAARAGILPGDRLMALDSVPIVAASVEELEVALAGPPHSDAVLTLERRRLDGSTVTLSRRVTRQAPDKDTSIPADFMLDGNTGYIRIESFLSNKTADDVHVALGSLRDQGMRRLVLDLRDNGGGLIDQAARVAGEFLPAGALIYTTDGRKKDAIDTGRVKRSFFRHEERYPLAVLINGGTASASELVAGALQDHDRAIIVGRPSFGKALMMRPVQLTDGSVLMLVVGHTRTPCGRIIQRSYRGLEVRDYYERAWLVRDTTGLPTCKTDAGRTVYGGGGIFPDVRLAPAAVAPVWLDRVRTDELPLQWIGGYLEANSASYTALDRFAAAPTIPDSAVASFRVFAMAHGDSIPDGSAADRSLHRMLLLALGQAKWGLAGYHRLNAISDPEVAAAAAALTKEITVKDGQ